MMMQSVWIKSMIVPFSMASKMTMPFQLLQIDQRRDQRPSATYTPLGHLRSTVLVASGLGITTKTLHSGTPVSALCEPPKKVLK
jgi:hypothetical protein